MGIRPQNSLLNEVVMADDGGEPDEFLYKVLVVGHTEPMYIEERFLKRAKGVKR